MKSCPQCLEQYPDTEIHCPKCATMLTPTAPSIEAIGNNLDTQFANLQAMFASNQNPLVSSVIPRPVIHQQSPIQMVAEMVARMHAITGIETIAVFCPHCKNFDDFTFIPVKKGIYERICKHDQSKRYNIEMGWFKEVSVRLIK